MKLFVYSYRTFDEDVYFREFSKEYGVELGICHQGPSMENAHLAEGYDYISILTSKINAALVRRFRELGVKMISTRTIGYDHIDLQRAELNDFSLPGIQGGELHNFTVGVIGTGKIGQAVIRDLSGFGCKIYAYDVYRSESVKEYADYVENVQEIYQKCDLITLHMPLFESNFHMIDEKAMAQMKDGVVLINTARGGLIDTKALIKGLETGKVGAAGLDVIEDEFGLYYKDLKSKCLSKHDLCILRSFPNVVVTPHTAFYTDQAVSDMVKNSILSCCLNERGEENPWEVK